MWKRLLLHHATYGSEMSFRALYTLYGVQSIDEIACDDLSKRLTLLGNSWLPSSINAGRKTHGKAHGKAISKDLGISLPFFVNVRNSARGGKFLSQYRITYSSKLLISQRARPFTNDFDCQRTITNAPSLFRRHGRDLITRAIGTIAPNHREVITSKLISNSGDNYSLVAFSALRAFEDSFVHYRITFQEEALHVQNAFSVKRSNTRVPLRSKPVRTL